MLLRCVAFIVIFIVAFVSGPASSPVAQHPAVPVGRAASSTGRARRHVVHGDDCELGGLPPQRAKLEV